jgi:PAS domain-containing protein
MKHLSAISMRIRIVLLGLIPVVPLVLLFVVRSRGDAGQLLSDLAVMAAIVVIGVGAAVLAADRLIFAPLNKQAEGAVDDMRKLLCDAMEAMQDGVAIYDAQDRLVLFNDALRRQRVAGQEVFEVGRSYEEIVGIYWADLGDSDRDYQEDVRVGLERHRRGDGQPFEVRDRDGSWRLTRHFRTRDGGIMTVSTDISALKRAEANAVRAEELFIDAIEAMTDAISLYDSDERLLLANQALMAGTPHFPDLLD